MAYWGRRGATAALRNGAPTINHTPWPARPPPTDQTSGQTAGGGCKRAVMRLPGAMRQSRRGCPCTGVPCNGVACASRCGLWKLGGGGGRSPDCGRLKRAQTKCCASYGLPCWPQHCWRRKAFGHPSAACRVAMTLLGALGGAMWPLLPLWGICPSQPTAQVVYPRYNVVV